MTAGVSLCLRSPAQQIGGVARSAEGVARSLLRSEIPSLSVIHRSAVNKATPPGLRPTSPINCAPLREQGRTLQAVCQTSNDRFKGKQSLTYALIFSGHQ